MAEVIAIVADVFATNALYHIKWLFHLPQMAITSAITYLAITSAITHLAITSANNKWLLHLPQYNKKQ